MMATFQESIAAGWTYDPQTGVLSQPSSIIEAAALQNPYAPAEYSESGEISPEVQAILDLWKTPVTPSPGAVTIRNPRTGEQIQLPNATAENIRFWQEEGWTVTAGSSLPGSSPVVPPPVVPPPVVPPPVVPPPVVPPIGTAPPTTAPSTDPYAAFKAAFRAAYGRDITQHELNNPEGELNDILDGRPGLTRLLPIDRQYTLDARVLSDLSNEDLNPILGYILNRDPKGLLNFSADRLTQFDIPSITGFYQVMSQVDPDNQLTKDLAATIQRVSGQAPIAQPPPQPAVTPIVSPGTPSPEVEPYPGQPVPRLGPAPIVTSRDPWEAFLQMLGQKPTRDTSRAGFARLAGEPGDEGEGDEGTPPRGWEVTIGENGKKYWRNTTTGGWYDPRTKDLQKDASKPWTPENNIEGVPTTALGGPGAGTQELDVHPFFDPTTGRFAYLQPKYNQWGDQIGFEVIPTTALPREGGAGRGPTEAEMIGAETLRGREQAQIRLIDAQIAELERRAATGDREAAAEAQRLGLQRDELQERSRQFEMGLPLQEATQTGYYRGQPTLTREQAIAESERRNAEVVIARAQNAAQILLRQAETAEGARQFDVAQQLRSKAQVFQEEATRAQQVLAERRLTLETGLQERQITEGGRQFNVAQALRGELGRGELGVAQQRAGTERELGLGRLGVETRGLDLQAIRDRQADAIQRERVAIERGQLAEAQAARVEVNQLNRERLALERGRAGTERELGLGGLAAQTRGLDLQAIRDRQADAIQRERVAIERGQLAEAQAARVEVNELNRQRLALEREQAGTERELGLGRLEVERGRAGTERELGLGRLGVERGQLGLAREQQAFAQARDPASFIAKTFALRGQQAPGEEEAFRPLSARELMESPYTPPGVKGAFGSAPIAETTRLPYISGQRLNLMAPTERKGLEAGVRGLGWEPEDYFEESARLSYTGTAPIVSRQRIGRYA